MARGKKTGGRVKGTPNHTTTAVKDMVVNALNLVGGEKYLAKQAKENPASFMSLVGRVIPTQVRAALTGGEGNPIIFEHFESIKHLSFEERQKKLDEMIEAAKHGPTGVEEWK